MLSVEILFPKTPFFVPGLKLNFFIAIYDPFLNGEQHGIKRTYVTIWALKH